MKHDYYYLLLFVFFFIPQSLFAQNGLCADIEPLCLTDDVIIFPNCFNGSSDCIDFAEEGPDYTCLGSTPYPTWQSITVDQSGDFDLLITQNTSFDTNGNPTGTPLDVDFIVWGPFDSNDDLCDYDNLTEETTVDCSFSAQAIESVSIPNAFAGERYVLLITNFNQTQGFIKVEQTGGDGSIICPVTSCEGDTITLQATMVDGTNYQWEVFDGSTFVTIPGETTPFLNVTENGFFRVSYTLSDNTNTSEEYSTNFTEVPGIVTPSDFVICDDENNDGIAEFVLSLKDAEIINGEANVIVSYFETEADAFANVAPLFDLYTNTVAFTQTIYARGENTITGCFAVVPLVLIVTESPVIATEIDDIIENDPDGDGFVTYDITVNIAQILGALDPTSFTVSFYVSEMDAQNAENVITNPTAFVNPLAGMTTTIYARLEANANGCFDIGDFDLLLSTAFQDSDNDTISDEDEDLNGNGNPNDDDTDGDTIPNYLDPDDDGDSVNTIIEIQGIGAGIVDQEDIDTDEDSILNYLDDDDDGDTILTINEDYNNNGSPLDDDLNTNGIPDFLDPDVALSLSEQMFTDLTVYPNPTQDIIQFTSSLFTQNTFIDIYDIQGRHIGNYKPEINTNSIEINLSNEASGIYFAHITTDNINVTRQLIKQ